MKLEVGDLVEWHTAPGYLEELRPFKIRAIESECAYLDWISMPVKLADLELVF